MVTQRHFLYGPGENIPLQSISLRFHGIIRIEGHLVRFVTRTFFTLAAPPHSLTSLSLQRISAPTSHFLLDERPTLYPTHPLASSCEH